MADLSEKTPQLSLVSVLETLASRQAVLFILELGFHSSSFEGDPEVSINALQHNNILHSAFGLLVKDTSSYVNSYGSSFSFSHTYR